jgi:hypothetical protein
MKSPASANRMKGLKKFSRDDGEMTRNSAGKQFRSADTATPRPEGESKFTQMSVRFLG